VAKRVFRKALGQPHRANPRTIAVDKNPAYSCATTEMKENSELRRFARLRQAKFLNKNIEQDHRRVKRLVRPGLGFGGFHTARRTPGRLRGDGDDQERAGSRHRRAQHAGPGQLRRRVVPGCRLILYLAQAIRNPR
jgi:DDE domain